MAIYLAPTTMPLSAMAMEGRCVDENREQRWTRTNDDVDEVTQLPPPDPYLALALYGGHLWMYGYTNFNFLPLAQHGHYCNTATSLTNMLLRLHHFSLLVLIHTFISPLTPLSNSFNALASDTMRI
jgi:hypothetical protein